MCMVLAILKNPRRAGFLKTIFPNSEFGDLGHRNVLGLGVYERRGFN